MSTRMPGRGDRTAPTFDPSKPRELKRYFADLEYLFPSTNVITDLEKKHYTTRYIDIDLADIWETLSEFEDPSKTYNDFKTAIRELYPAANEDYKYTISDLDLLIQNQHNIGIHSLINLAEYHLQFLAITRFLISKSRLSEIEQKRIYPHGFQLDLWTKISHRLQLKFLDHLPDDPYDISDIHAAARFVLHGTQYTSIATSATPSSAPSSLDSIVKTEQITSIIAGFTKSIIEAIQSTQDHRTSSPASSSTSIRRIRCRFCGNDHYIRNCDLVDKYLQLGKVKRSLEGNVILPTGAFVPRDIPGEFLKDQIDEWHRRNPGQLAAASLSYSMFVNTVPVVSNSISISASFQKSYYLEIDERIAQIESELVQLRSQQTATVMSSYTRSSTSQHLEIDTGEFTSAPIASTCQTTLYTTSGCFQSTQQSLSAQIESSISPEQCPVDITPPDLSRSFSDTSDRQEQHRDLESTFQLAATKNELDNCHIVPHFDSVPTSDIPHRSLEVSIENLHQEHVTITSECRSKSCIDPASHSIDIKSLDSSIHSPDAAEHSEQCLDHGATFQLAASKNDLDYQHNAPHFDAVTVLAVPHRSIEVPVQFLHTDQLYIVPDHRAKIPSAYISKSNRIQEYQVQNASLHRTRPLDQCYGPPRSIPASLKLAATPDRHPTIETSIPNPSVNQHHRSLRSLKYSDPNHYITSKIPTALCSILSFIKNHHTFQFVQHPG